MDGLQITGNNTNQRNSMTGNKRFWNESSKISKLVEIKKKSKQGINITSVGCKVIILWKAMQMKTK